MDSRKTIEHLFRHEYGKIVSVLTTKFSAKNIDLIEDAVQDALVKAMQVWSYQAIPQNPSGWLFKVANNFMIDVLRRDSKKQAIENLKEFSEAEIIDEESLTIGIEDDLLKMIFACCHPVLNPSEQVVLSLKILCGLNVVEISSALMKNNEAVKKSITRAKQKFKNEIGELNVPNENEIDQRLDSVLTVIYLLFNEGYKAADGEQLIKKDICEEAIRLALILRTNKKCNTPKLNALLALMYFNASRFDSRINENGELIILQEQNRALWKREYINLGFFYLTESTAGDDISKYHFEAGIASFYSSANSFEETNWEGILSLYNRLILLNDSPIAKLNRLVVLAKVKGVNEALIELKKIEKEKSLESNHILYSIKADFELMIGNEKSAKALLERAIELTENKIEKDFLRKKMEGLDIT